MTLVKPLLAALIATFLPSLCWATEAEDQLGANLLAQGWTGVANPSDAAAVSLNPGVMGLEPHYKVQAQLRYGVHPHLGWGISLLDSKTSDFVSGGVSYHRTSGEPPIHPDELPGWFPTGQTPSNLYTDHNFTVGFAIPVWEDRVSFGVNGTLTIEDHARLGESVTGNMDVGFGTQPIDAITLGIVGRNLLPVPGQGKRPMALEGGLRLLHPELGHSVSVDVGRKLERTAEGTPYRVGAGVDVLARMLSLRGGYRYEGAETQHYATAGVGMTNESGGIEYGVAVPLNGFLPGTMIHQLSLRIQVKLPGDEDWDVP